MQLKSLHELLVHELKDLYDAEHQVVAALPKMAKAAKSAELKQAFESHLRQSEDHIQRLEQVFGILGEKASRVKCKGMAGLIKEGDETIQEDADPDVRDAALIAAAQRVEHYEMAGYGACRTYARLLGYHQATNLLQQTLNDEGEADKKLTAIAENKINVRAMEHAPGIVGKM
jgi:ferritin-like metal-binding protein YciE